LEWLLMIRVTARRAVFVAFGLAFPMLAMTGACSQHQPGTYEGGGRSFEVPTAQGTTTPPDSGPPDTFVPDSFVPDSFVADTFVPDAGGGG
jgi:hypothetical protein